MHHASVAWQWYRVWHPYTRAEDASAASSFLDDAGGDVDASTGLERRELSESDYESEEEDEERLEELAAQLRAWLRGEALPAGAKARVLRCTLCDALLLGPAVFQQHLTSKRHVKNLERARREDPPPSDDEPDELDAAEGICFAEDWVKEGEGAGEKIETSEEGRARLLAAIAAADRKAAGLTAEPERPAAVQAPGQGGKTDAKSKKKEEDKGAAPGDKAASKEDERKAPRKASKKATKAPVTEEAAPATQGTKRKKGRKSGRKRPGKRQRLALKEERQKAAA